MLIWQPLSYNPQDYKVKRLHQSKELILSFLRVYRPWGLQGPQDTAQSLQKPEVIEKQQWRQTALNQGCLAQMNLV